jgi:hypothetical protein
MVPTVLALARRCERLSTPATYAAGLPCSPKPLVVDVWQGVADEVVAVVLLLESLQLSGSSDRSVA